MPPQPRDLSGLRKRIEELVTDFASAEPALVGDLPRLFQEFLRLWRATGGDLDNVAIVDESPVSSPGSPNPVYQFERWLDRPARSDVTLLVGTTLNRALSQNEGIWRSYLQRGGRLKVLVQSGLDDWNALVTRASAHIRGRSSSVLTTRMRGTIEVLRRLQDATGDTEGALEVRQTDDLLTYSAVVFWRENGQIDIQIHPYASVHNYYRNPRFLIVGAEHTKAFAAAITPIEYLWDGAQRISF